MAVEYRATLKYRVEAARETDSTNKRIKETVESELCKRFYFAWIFNIESRDFASRLLFIETFSSPDTVIDNNRPWKEFFSHFSRFYRENRYVFISFLSLPSYCFSFIYYLVCFIQIHINYVLIPSVKLIFFSFPFLYLLRNSRCMSYLPWKEFFLLFYYISLFSIIIYLKLIDILIHINYLFTHY